MSKQDVQPSRSETGFWRRLFRPSKPVAISQEKFLAGEDELMEPEKVVEELTEEQAAEKKEAELQVKAGSVLRLMLRANGFIHVSQYDRDDSATLIIPGAGSCGMDPKIVQLLVDGGCLVSISAETKVHVYIVNSDFAESLERPETLTAVSRE